MTWSPNVPRFPEGNRPGPGRRNNSNWRYIKSGVVITNTGQSVGSGMSNPFVSSGRIPGALAEYWFTEGTGSTVFDRTSLTLRSDIGLSGGEWAIASEGRYVWTTSGIAGSGVGLPIPNRPNINEYYRKIASIPKSTQGLTLEAWIKPVNVTQEGPARIFSYANPYDPTGELNFLLGQGMWGTYNHAQIHGRARVKDSLAGTGSNRQIRVSSGDNSITAGALTHVVFTVEGDNSKNKYVGKTYINGIKKGDTVEGDYQHPSVESLSGIFFGEDSIGNGSPDWEKTYQITVASPPSSIPDNPRTWAGDYYLLATYPRALNAGEIGVNYQAGVLTTNVFPVPKWGFTASSPIPSSVDSGTTGGSDIEIFSQGVRNSDSTITVNVESSGLVSGTDYTTNCPVVATFTKSDYAKTNIIDYSLSTNSPSGALKFTLASPSVGTVSAAASSYTITVNSLSGTPTIGFSSSSVTGYTYQTSIGMQLSSNKHTSSNMVGIVGTEAAGNTGVAFIVDNSGVLTPVDGVSVATVEMSALETNYGVVLSSFSGTTASAFVSGNVYELSTFSATNATLGENVTCSATIENANNNSEIPGPHNTGPEGITEDQAILVGNTAIGTWWDGDNLVDTDHGGLVVEGYKFIDKGVRFENVHNLGFKNCFFRRTSASTGGNAYLWKSTQSGANPSNISAIQCLFTGGDEVLGWDDLPGAHATGGINMNGIGLFHKCEVSQITGDGIAKITQTNTSNPSLKTTTITNNWFHHNGSWYQPWPDGNCACWMDQDNDCKAHTDDDGNSWTDCYGNNVSPYCQKTCKKPHADALDGGLSVKCDVTITGNYFENPKNRDSFLVLDGEEDERGCNCCNNPQDELGAPVSQGYHGLDCKPAPGSNTTRATSINWIVSLKCNKNANCFGKIIFSNNWINGHNNAINMGTGPGASSTIHHEIHNNKFGPDYWGKPFDKENQGDVKNDTYDRVGNRWWLAKAGQELIGPNGNMDKPSNWSKWRTGMRPQCADNGYTPDLFNCEGAKWVGGLDPKTGLCTGSDCTNPCTNIPGALGCDDCE